MTTKWKSCKAPIQQFELSEDERKKAMDIQNRIQRDIKATLKAVWSAYGKKAVGQ